MKTIVTHGGIFHADDVFAVATALLLYPDLQVIRSRDPEAIQRADIVVDAGMEYDPQKFRFDHHQVGGAGIRPNGIPYASFGLVWKHFGLHLASLEAWEIIDEKLVMPIDAPDNGVSVYTPIFDNVQPYSIRDFFYSFLSYEREGEEYLHEVFMQIVGIAKDVLAREIAKAEEKVGSMKKVRHLYDIASDKRIIVMDEQLPWERILVPMAETLFVIYPRREGNWGIKSVPKKTYGFERKKLLPAAWAGKGAEEFAQVTGVADAIFCHKDRFIAAARTKESAIALAQIALNS